MKFKLIGDENHRVGFWVKHKGQRGEERRKIHLPGGKWIDPENIKIPISVDGQIVQVPIDTEQFMSDIKKILKNSPSHIKFAEEEDEDDGLIQGEILEKPEPIVENKKSKK